MRPATSAFRGSTLFALVLATSVGAQPATRRATNVAALIAHPGFYHLRPIVIVGQAKVEDNGEIRISGDTGSVRVLFKGNVPDGLDEVRGEFWDIGRMRADDPRLSGYDLKTALKIDPDGAWPRAGQVTAIVASTITQAPPPLAPSIRNIVLHPSRYIDQKVTVVGQYAGRNLLGDLPDAPAQSRYDFVLRSTDAAIWISNLRPRGKDFELALDARIDTGRWLEVTGTLQQARGLQWLDGQAGSLKITQAPKDTTEETIVRVAPGPPPDVVFSAPIPDETDVLPSSSVRIQFSRDIDGTTFKGRVRIGYSDSAVKGRTETPTPAPQFTTRYLPGTRVLEIRFSNPLERFRTVKVELLEGIAGTDKQPLKPWSLTFQTGG